MQSDTVECKPTMWFTGRAVIMALMFLGFGVYFYYDASTGYPQKNLEFFMHKAFVDAGAVFDREVSGKGASAGDWERIVLARTVDFPEGYEIPSDVNRNAVPWPDILADYSLMSTPGKGWSAAWHLIPGKSTIPSSRWTTRMTPPKFLNSGWPGAFAWRLPWWLCFSW